MEVKPGELLRVRAAAAGPHLVPTYKKSPSGLAVTHVTPGMSEKVYVSASGDGPVSSSTTCGANHVRAGEKPLAVA